MSLPDLAPLWLTFRLAFVVTLILLIIGAPFAWWLAHTKSRLKPIFEAVTALPLVLPPTVLGFYFLLILSPNSAFGSFWVSMTGEALVFSFTGLVIASVAYSAPFMIQPLQSGFEAIGRAPLEAAATMGASPRDAFFTVAAPMAGRSFLTAIVLTFAHTIGEFGVVLMVGGAIPGETKVISIQIYEAVETINYGEAHLLSGGLMVFSFLVLLMVYAVNRRFPVGVGG